MPFVFPPAVGQLLKSIQILPPVPSAVVDAGKPVSLALDPNPSVLKSLSAEHLVDTFNVGLTNISLGGVGLATDDLKLDIGNLSTSLDLTLNTVPGPVTRQWAPQSDYSVGQVVLPPTDNGRYYVAAVPGRTGDTPPNFPTTPNATVSEGDSSPKLTWSCQMLEPPGEVDVAYAQRTVEFEKPAETLPAKVDIDKPATNALPYLVPVDDLTSKLGDKVQGVIGRLKGSVRQVKNLSGTLSGVMGQSPGTSGKIAIPEIALTAAQTGSMVLSLTKGTLLPPEREVRVAWRVEDEHGRRLSLGQDFLMKDDVRPGEAPDPAKQLLALLPEFVSYIPGAAEVLSQRRVFCTITLSVTVPAEDGKTETHSLTHDAGPITVSAPKLPIPTILAMTETREGEPGFPGEVLVAVPGNAAEATVGRAAELVKPLADVLTVVGNVEAFVALDKVYAGLKLAVPRLQSLLLSPRVRLWRAERDQVLDLSAVPRAGAFWWWEHFEDMVSSVVFIGPPGRQVTCHVKKNLWEYDGVLHLTLGLLDPAAYVANLGAKRPVLDLHPEYLLAPPMGPKCAYITDATHAPGATFDNNLSSFQFLAPGEPYVFRGL